MVRCAAVGCDNDHRSSEGSYISFYCLPKNKDLNAIKRDRFVCISMKINFNAI